MALGQEQLPGGGRGRRERTGVLLGRRLLAGLGLCILLASQQPGQQFMIERDRDHLLLAVPIPEGRDGLIFLL